MTTQQTIDDQTALALEHENLLPPTEEEKLTEDTLAETEVSAEAPSAEEAPTERPPTEEKEPGAPPVLDGAAALKAENTRLRLEADQRQQAVESQQIVNHVREYEQGYTTKLVAAGWDDEQAKAHSRALGDAAISEYQLLVERKAHLADRLSREHGVPITSLMPYNTAAEMEAAAQQLGPQAREMDVLKKEIAELKKGRIPAQHYNQSGSKSGGGPVTSDEILTAIGNGTLDAANLTAKHRETLQASGAL